jgi:hypothetical protein
MKKDKTKTHGYTLTMLFIGTICFFGFLYLKWYYCDRDKEIENRQLQEMVDYHRDQGREIIVFE